MKVNLAGYNIDSSLIDNILSKSATPETISAAYARISRSSDSADVLRKKALLDVHKARASNTNIAFDMGHSSISEHAVFNFDIIGVSRLLAESIQKTRLASFTEKSQRYVTVGRDYVVPKELEGTPLKKKFESLVKQQSRLYYKLFELGKENLEQNSGLKSKRDIAIKSKEDARYFLPLASTTQMGMTINARSLCRLLVRLHKSDFAEAKELFFLLEKPAKKVAPSLVKRTTSTSFGQKLQHSHIDTKPLKWGVKIVDKSSNIDDLILTTLFFEKGFTCSEAKKRIRLLAKDKKERFFEEFFKNLTTFDVMPRAFEFAFFTFEIVCSATCFAQLKRHRMFTILNSNYVPQNGFITPPLVKKLKMDREISQIIDNTKNLYSELENFKRGLGSYILTNSNMVSVLVRTNLRHLYHFSRLRADEHAQWEIQNIAKKVDELVKSQAPLSARYLGGKSKFEGLF